MSEQKEELRKRVKELINKSPVQSLHKSDVFEFIYSEISLRDKEIESLREQLETAFKQKE